MNAEEEKRLGTGLAVGFAVVFLIYLGASWIMINLDACNQYFTCP